MRLSRPVQLYGQFDSFWSNANVSRGIARGLAANGIPLRLWDRTGTYLGLDGVEFETGMSSADSTGCFVGYPHMSLDLLADHDVKVGFFIAESSVLPTQWAMAAARCDLVVVPSLWTKGAYVRGGVDPTKVMVRPHGLDPVFRDAWRSRVLTWGKQYPTVEEPLRFLHIAGARDFIERKGTPQLLTAFVKVAQAAAVQMHLTVRTPTSPWIEALRRAADPDGKFITMDYHDAPLPPAEMVKYLIGTHWSALIQPSRAEAFGICLKRGTFITTPLGATKIEDVQVGDRVLTHRGEWRRVIGVAQRSKKNILRIRASGIPDLLITAEHEVLTAGRGGKVAYKPELYWLPAARLDTRQYLVLRGPRQQSRPFGIPFVSYTMRPITFPDGTFTCRWSSNANKNLRLPQVLPWSIEFCRLLGYYAAEGSTFAKEHGVSWALHRLKDIIPQQQILEAVHNLGFPTTTRRKGCYGLEILCSSTLLARMFKDLCGTGARNKKLPEAVWGLSNEERTALLYALLRGDGCVEDGTLSYCTTSTTLALQVRDLWLSIGIPARWRIRRMAAMRGASLSPIRRRGVIQHSKKPCYNITVSGKWYEIACAALQLTPKRTATTVRRGSQLIAGPDGTWLTPVKNITRERVTVPLYDLQVIEDASYIAGGVVVHNCPVEARACGIPVIMTSGHGHRMHVEEIDTLIPDGEVEAAIQVNGIPGGVAPTVDARDIEAALCTFVDDRRRLRSAALELPVGSQWSYSAEYDWGSLMRPVAEWLKAKSPRGRSLRTL